MTWVAAATIGSAVLGAGASIIGGAQQAGAIREGAELSIEEQRRQFDIAQQLSGPQREAEDAARQQLLNVLGIGDQDFDPSGIVIPGQQFAIDESQRAVERSAAARGGLVSGGTLAELQNRALGITNQNFLSNFLNPLQRLAGGTAGQVAGQQALNLGVNIGNTQQNLATNRANIIGQQFGGVNQAVQGGLSNFLLNQQLNQQPSGLTSLELGSTITPRTRPPVPVLG